MSKELFLKLLRQYAELTRRNGRSYAVQVDALTEKYASSAGIDLAPEEGEAPALNNLVDREYNPVYRRFPNAR